MHPYIKVERFRIRCLKFPGLIQQNFPDDMFTIPFDVLHTQITESNTVRWQHNKKTRTWDLSFNRAIVSDDVAAAEEREVLLVRWLNKLTSDIARICNIGDATQEFQPSREWVFTDDKQIHLVAKNQRTTALATAGLVESHSREDKPFLPPNCLDDSADKVFSSGDESRLHFGIAFCHSEVRVFGFTCTGGASYQSFNVRDDPAMLIRLIGGLMLMRDTDIVGSSASVLQPAPVADCAPKECERPLFVVLPAPKTSAPVRGTKRKLDVTEYHVAVPAPCIRPPQSDEEGSKSTSSARKRAKRISPADKPVDSTRRSNRIKERKPTTSKKT